MLQNEKRLISIVFAFVTLVSVLLIATCGNSGDDRPWLRSSGTIKGTVVIPTGVSPANIRVSLDENSVALTDTRGNFSFSLVAPGSHLIEVGAKSYLYSGQEWVVVEAEQTVEVEIELTKTPGVGTTIGALDVDDMPDLTTVNIQDISGEGELIVLCDHDNGFEVVNVSDPATPLYLGRSVDGRNCDALVVELPFVFIGWNDGLAGEGGIAIYSLEDPSAPQKVHEAVTSNRVYAIAKEGDNIYALGTNSFQVYDVSLSSSGIPSVISSLPLRGEGVAYRDGYVYLGTDPEVLTVVDVSNAVDPKIVWQSTELASSVDVALDGYYAYVAALGKVYQYDVRDPHDVRLVNVIDAQYLEAQGAQLGGSMGLEGLTVENRDVYLGAVFDGLVVVDYSDHHRPMFSWQSDGFVPFAMNVFLSGRYSHVAAWREGYRIVLRK